MNHRSACIIPFLVLALSACKLVADAPTDERVSSSRAAAASDRRTGIWYSTYYSNDGTYLWRTGHGQGSSAQFLADVNHDGRADAVVYFANDGAWYAAISNGSGFAPYSLWRTGFGVGSARQFLADVNHDGNADAVAFFSNGSWYVALSNGTSDFGGGSTPATTGHGAGSTNQLLADVNHDGNADAVVFFNNGSWYVALSNGTNGFGGYSLWRTGHGANSNDQFLVDVNADANADAVAYFGNTGSWYVALSNGTNGFAGYSQWVDGFGVGSDRRLLHDVDGDGRADAIAYYASGGTWFLRRAQASSFGELESWIRDHGNATLPGYVPAADNVFVADVYGDGSHKAGAVLFTNANGEWRALPAERLYTGYSGTSRYNTPMKWNIWEASNIRYRPRTLGTYRRYSTKETAVVDEHLDMIRAAGIDFLILDETNNIDTEWIKDGAWVTCERIAARRLVDPTYPRFAVAVGGIQFSEPTNPALVEFEARVVLEEFVTGSHCGPADNYVMVDEKPLLIVYANDEQRAAWEASLDKTYTKNFTVRFMQGPVPASETRPYYGWSVPEGSFINDEVMVVMPGHNNRDGFPVVSRAGGYHYSTLCWQRVLTNVPDIAVINSFNEYAEETAVAPADTSQLILASETWPNPDFYWQMTVDKNAAYDAIP